MRACIQVPGHQNILDWADFSFRSLPEPAAILLESVIVSDPIKEAWRTWLAAWVECQRMPWGHGNSVPMVAFVSVSQH